MTALVAAAATVHQTTPRRTSGPGRMSIQFFDHQTLILSHTSFPRSHRDMSHPPSVTTTLGVLKFRNGRKSLPPLAASPADVLTIRTLRSQVHALERFRAKKAPRHNREAFIPHCKGIVWKTVNS